MVYNCDAINFGCASNDADGVDTSLDCWTFSQEAHLGLFGLDSFSLKSKAQPNQHHWFFC